MFEFPEVIEALYFIAMHPFTEITIESSTFKLLERFVIIVYDSGSNLLDINQCRMELLAKRKQDLEMCPPPTKEALLYYNT